ncbi:translation initiation factor IF-2-like isoform X5 [Dermochelys coriacea]|uniref:translation initiation factor IF-2-like isoform X5 n=1 Tax=Dermochelys coriacea TaxID=27794 RepID=UPI001CA99E74|nr:translation initiation factor IF-2-like isoform X5 [Dermochelys coriacea]
MARQSPGPCLVAAAAAALRVPLPEPASLPVRACVCVCVCARARARAPGEGPASAAQSPLRGAQPRRPPGPRLCNAAGGPQRPSRGAGVPASPLRCRPRGREPAGGPVLEEKDLEKAGSQKAHLYHRPHCCDAQCAKRPRVEQLTESMKHQVTWIRIDT